VVIQQNSRKLLMMDIFISETCWARKRWNKIANDIKLVFILQLCNDFRNQVDVSAVAVRVFVYSPLINERCGSKRWNSNIPGTETPPLACCKHIVLSQSTSRPSNHCNKIVPNAFSTKSCIFHYRHHHHKHQDWTLWSVPSPELQLHAPTLLRSSNCSPSLWSVVVWFQRDSVFWYSLQVWKPVPSVFIYLV